MSKEELLREIDAAIARITAAQAAAEQSRPEMLQELEEKRRKLDALHLRVEQDVEMT
jgi:hypothetical protein